MDIVEIENGLMQLYPDFAKNVSQFPIGKTGLLNVIDNKIGQRQAAGVTKKSHNVLSVEDVYALYRSNSLSKRNGQGFVSRMIFNSAFDTGFRSTELLNLTWDDVQHMRVGSEDVWRITGKIGSKTGASKPQGGGMRYVNVRQIC